MTGRYAGLRLPNHVTFATPFIGKQDHLELIWRHYTRARAGHAGIVIVIGPPGVGKTYLLAHLATRAAQEGATIFQGHASETEGMPPYLPFLEALGHYIRHAPLDQLREQAAFAPEILASILPELRTRLGDLPAPYHLPPALQRLRLYEAVGAFLEAISMDNPLLLLLDDLHLADAESLSLLCHIALRHPKARLLILGAYREGEPQQNLALVRAITELTRHRMLITIKPQPLSLADIEALAQTHLGQPIELLVTLHLFAQSEGNPLFAEELLHYWVEMGAIVHEDGRYALASIVTGLPSGITHTLRHQLAQLSSEAIEHLRVAAIIGRTFDVALLAAVEGQEIEAVEEGLLEAVRAHLVQPDHADSFSFNHRLIHEYLYDEVIPSRRRRLHERIAQVLAGRYDQEPGRNSKLLAELAFHCARSGDQVRGGHYAQRAAGHILQEYAFHVIEILIGVPLPFVDGRKKLTGAFSPGVRNHIYLENKRRDGSHALESIDIWLGLVSNLEAAARSAQEAGLVEWCQETMLAAQKALAYALVLVEQCPSPTGLQTLVDLVMPLALHTRCQADGQAYGQRLLALAHGLENDQGTTVTHPLTGERAPWCSKVMIDHLYSLEHTLALIETCDHLGGTTECWLCLVGAYYWMGEISKSFDVTLRWIACSEHSRCPDEAWAVHAWLGLLHASQGSWLDAEQTLKQVLSLTPPAMHAEVPGLLRFVRGFLAFQRGDYHTAGQTFQMVLTDLWNDTNYGVFFAPLLSQIVLHEGKQDEAFRFLTKLQELRTRLPTGSLLSLPILLALALLALALEEKDQAVDMYQALLPFQGQHCWFLVDRVLGAIVTLSGDWHTAEMYFARAEATARREGLLPELARTFLGHADLELAKGKEYNALQANTYLAEALALFEKLAMYEAADGIRSRLGLLRRQPDKLKALALPAGLTRREVAVLRLVAEGKSNYQIAQELGLSEKTIANHLTTIFYKTASENRAAAAAFAIRHGLA